MYADRVPSCSLAPNLNGKRELHALRQRMMGTGCDNYFPESERMARPGVGDLAWGPDYRRRRLVVHQGGSDLRQ
jgi:hypothetical protein